MGKHSRTHAGVRTYFKGNACCVQYTENGIQRRKGLGVIDKRLAEEMATQIYQILNKIEIPVSKLHPVVANMFSIAPDPNDSVQWFKEPIEVLGMTPDDEKKAMRDTIKELQTKLDKAEKLVAYYGSIAAAKGDKLIAVQSTKTVEDAILGFLASNTEISTRTIKSYKSQLNIFKKKFTPDRVLTSIDPQEIVDFLIERSKVTKQIQYAGVVFKAMLKHATGSQYDIKPITQWISKNAQKKAKTQETDFYWLDESEVLKLAEHVKNTDSEYWHDVIMTQFYLGLRPEEISVIQNKNINIQKASVYLSGVNINGLMVRTLKTENSTASLPIAAKLLPILERRSQATDLVTFPTLGARRLNAKTALDPVCIAQVQNKIWNGDDFCITYLEKLRSAATAVGILHLNADGSSKLDSRTLRRSRGRDIIVKGGSAEKAATMLRDSLETVIRHYAKLLPKDCKVD